MRHPLDARVWTAVLVVCCGGRSLFFVSYAWQAISSPREAFPLEGVTTNLAWRVQHSQSLYPKGDAYPYVVNYLAPAYYWTVGLTGRLIGADVRGLYLLGRILTLACTVAAAFIAAWYCHRKHGYVGSVAAGLYCLGAGPVIGFGVMARPDMMADLLGVVGFLVATRKEGTRLWIGAVLLCLAILTKQTMVVYLLAALLVLLTDGRVRDCFSLFVMVIISVASSGLAIFCLAEPHFFSSLFGHAAVPMGIHKMLTVCFLLVTETPDIIVFSIVGICMWKRQDKGLNRDLIVLAFVTIIVGIAMSAKAGADVNYFMPLRFIAAVAFGTVAAKAVAPVGSWRASTGLLFCAAIILLSLAAMVNKKDLLFSSSLLENDEQLAAFASDPQLEVLTDASQLAAYQGIRAPFLDVFLFRLRVDSTALSADGLLERIVARQFDAVILRCDINSPSYNGFSWRLPIQVAAEIRDHYVLASHSNGFWLYLPRKDT